MSSQTESSHRQKGDAGLSADLSTIEGDEAGHGQFEIRNSRFEMNRKGGNTMSQYTKKLVAGVVGLGMMVMVGLVREAGATNISSNNAAGLTVRISPHTDRGVEISSGDVNLNLGVVDTNVSTKTVNPATMTIVGNVNNTELTLAANIAGGWTFDDNTLNAESDQLATWALFSAIAISTVPSDAEFEIYNSTINVAAVSFGATQVGDTTNRFEGGWTGSDTDAMAIATRRHLWVRMRTPLTTSVDAEQTITFTLVSEAGN